MILRGHRFNGRSKDVSNDDLSTICWSNTRTLIPGFIVTTVGMAVRERLVIHRGEDGEIMDEKPTVETESYIISRQMHADEFACFSRHYWPSRTACTGS